MTKDLTNGSPAKALLSFTLPVLAGNIFQQIYNITDTAIVGQLVGVDALAGVGATGCLNFLILGFVTGTCTGFSVPVAQSFGAGKEKDMRKYFVNSLWLGVLISVVLTVLTLIFIDPILKLIQTPDNIFEYSKTYIGTIFAGITGIMLYNLMASVLRAIGDSKTPVIFLLFASVLNVILDLVSILVFDMGVFGTSLATVISQTTSGLLCVLLVAKRFPILHPKKDELRFSPAHAKYLCATGVPMGLQFSITAIGSTVLQGAMNSLGSGFVAASTAAGRISGFATQGVESLGLAMATYTGQNLGAGKIDRIKKGVVSAILMGSVYSVVMFLVLLFFSKTLALIFISPDQTEVIDNVSLMLIVHSSFYIMLGILMVFRNTIQGAGYSSLAMGAGFVEMIARCVVAFGFVGTFGFGAVCASNPVAWVSANLFLFPAYLYILKKITVKAKANVSLDKA